MPHFVPSHGGIPMQLSRLLPLSAVAIAGCAAAVTTVDGRRLGLSDPELPAYVEGVFRDQNQVATDLAFALDDAAAGSARAARLSAAEDALLAACADLNEIATLRRDERRAGLKLKLETAKSAPRCEAATLGAKRALESASQ
jgi:hypothetical protein